MRGRGKYPENWKRIALEVKEAAGWKCIRCQALHGSCPDVLTVHHFDGDKSNSRWWNLLALCQRCHLSVQGRVNSDQAYMYEHADWFKHYVAGFYAFKYLDEDLTRTQVKKRIEELLGLEWMA